MRRFLRRGFMARLGAIVGAGAYTANVSAETPEPPESCGPESIQFIVTPVDGFIEFRMKWKGQTYGKKCSAQFHRFPGDAEQLKEIGARFSRLFVADHEALDQSRAKIEAECDKFNAARRDVRA